VRYSGLSTTSSANAISAGTWYVIDLRLNVGANPNTSTGASTPPPRPRGENKGTTTVTVHFDDLMVTTTSADYPIGSGAILGLVPNVRAAVNDSGGDIKNNAGAEVSTDANVWNRVDEIPMTVLTDFVQMDATNASSYLALGFQDTSATCVSSVNAVSAVHSSTTTPTAPRRASSTGHRAGRAVG
jgi:hypothetical protein